MSTRAIIGLFVNNNAIHYIYLHRNASPDDAGKILTQYYNNEEKIVNLLDLGNLSNLCEYLEDCTAYNESKTIKDCDTTDLEKAFFSEMHECIVDYGYLFINNQWKCWNHNNEPELLDNSIMGTKTKNDVNKVIDVIYNDICYIAGQIEVMTDILQKEANMKFIIAPNLDNISSASNNIKSQIKALRVRQQKE